MRERIFLVRRVKVDKEEAASVAELELHRSRGWAYKWLKRYDNENLEGLKDKPRSGRPPDITEEKLLGIKKELSENPSGWRAKEIMNIIYSVVYVYAQAMLYVRAKLRNLCMNMFSLSALFERLERPGYSAL
jgi:transposase